MSSPSWQDMDGGADERPSLKRAASEPPADGEALVSHLVERLSRAEGAARHAERACSRSAAHADLLGRAARLLAEHPAESLTEIAALALPVLGTWCVLEELAAGRTERHAAALDAALDARLSAPDSSVTEIMGDVPSLVIPVISQGRGVGTLTLGRGPDDADYDDESEATARAFAALLALAMEHRRMSIAADVAAHTKAEFLKMMSHELRTPLNAIGGYGQLLEMGHRGPLSESQRDAVTRILRGQAHLLELVDAVLTFSRLTSGRLQLDSAAMLATDLMERAAEPILASFAERRIDFRITACTENPEVCADRERAPEVLGHLLSNALKFTPEGGRVTLSCEVAELVVQFVVEDSGRGIPESQRESIFQPFVQVERAHTRSVDGTGLGLAVGRELASRMGGSLTVTSTEGTGSRFVLTLSRLNGPPASRKAGRPSGALPQIDSPGDPG